MTNNVPFSSVHTDLKCGAYPAGKLLESRPMGWPSVYERDRFFTIREGVVIVQNMIGEPCHEFSVSLTNKNGQTRTTTGTACRKNGTWVWPNG
jgi:hypothetical protein